NRRFAAARQRPVNAPQANEVESMTDAVRTRRAGRNWRIRRASRANLDGDEVTTAVDHQHWNPERCHTARVARLEQPSGFGIIAVDAADRRPDDDASTMAVFVRQLKPAVTQRLNSRPDSKLLVTVTLPRF